MEAEHTKITMVVGQSVPVRRYMLERRKLFPDHFVILTPIEGWLHPKDHLAEAGYFKRMAETFGPIACNSNSPYAVDAFTGEEVVCVKTSNKFARLSEHPDFQKWADTMATGEFWSMVGEDWVDSEL